MSLSDCHRWLGERSVGTLAQLDSSPPQTKIAVAVVCRTDENDQPQILVGSRGEGQTLAGFREFPGGKIQHDETVFEAAERECDEETGVPVGAIELLTVTQHAYEYGQLELHFVFCEPRGAAIPQSPFEGLPLASLNSCRFPAANRDALACLQARCGI